MQKSFGRKSWLQDKDDKAIACIVESIYSTDMLHK